ncbi:TPA: hypothetical protein N0F65_004503 [Lagenidium giganteum]|uniref:Smr domain-containing protein n=1 Tax=Lagenidium giganteum TaxID=4803 RepID=A0AAV2YVY3_9STRA|nr:TPA: hypothetical protein N0F65_004503 [Lagenidium giganteum]
MLEVWAKKRLEDLGVDGVFAPYIVGMLEVHDDDGSETPLSEDDEQDVKFNIHQVLMGWLSPEDEEKAQEFVDDLVKFAKNSALLSGLALHSPDPTTSDDNDGSADVMVEPSIMSSTLANIDDLASETAELKASAPTFVPGGLYSIVDDGLDGEEAVDTAAAAAAVDELVTSEEPSEETEDSFFWSVAFELVSHLQLKFAEVDPVKLCELLRLVNLDMDQAHAILKRTMENETVGTGQVCRHHLQGECRRADCMFVHDTDRITCRFWLRGTCLQSDHCVFAHEFVEYYNMEGTPAAREYDSEDEGEEEVLDFGGEMFPSLGSSAPAAKNPTTNLTMNFARAVSLAPSHSSPPPQPQHTSSAPRRQPPFRPLYHKTAEAVAGDKWFSTGAAVSAQYQELRETAYQLACARNKCFMGATQAYRNGNKSLAKSLSNQGQDYNTKMKKYHFMAASQIFNSRNPTSQLYDERLMDLHGLHVAEAVEFLSHMLPKLADEGLESIYIVTGSGHHSKGPQGNARLLPAVERFLATDGYQFSPVADRRGYVGMLMVDLRW